MIKRQVDVHSSVLIVLPIVIASTRGVQVHLHQTIHNKHLGFISLKENIITFSMTNFGPSKLYGEPPRTSSGWHKLPVIRPLICVELKEIGEGVYVKFSNMMS